MSKHNPNYRTKKTEDGRTVLDGSTPRPAAAPTAAPKSKGVFGDPSLDIPIPAFMQPGYKFPKDALNMTGDELDIQQDYEDYLSILEDMDGGNYRTAMPPQEIIDLFDERVKQFAKSEFGQRTLKNDHIGFLMNLDSGVDPETNESDALTLEIIEKYLNTENQ